MEVQNNVVNLWVVRSARSREYEESRLVWRCDCGCRHFYWYDVHGLRCVECDKWAKPRSPYGGNNAS